MGLFSFFQRKGGSSRDAAGPRDTAAVETERRRARRRLVGAVVLVLIGVVGFPLLFDTAPRPVPVDIPIEIPRKEAAPPLVAKAPVTKSEAAPAEPSASSAPREEAVQPKAAELPAEKPVEKPAEKPAERKAEPIAPPPTAKKPSAEAARAQATLEDRPVAVAKPEPASRSGDAAVRFVVQVGAFSEVESAREARARVEKLGLKTYTQVVETSAGKRIRVRVGPYNDRGEAEKVAAQIKQSAGIASAVLTL